MEDDVRRVGNQSGVPGTYGALSFQEPVGLIESSVFQCCAATYSRHYKYLPYVQRSHSLPVE